MEVDKTAVKPYGDAPNDGKVQLSFTLPLKASAKSREAARKLASKMGLEEVDVVHMKDLKENFSFFVIYGQAKHEIDVTGIDVATANEEAMEFQEINSYIETELGRKITVVGACTGSDAHTVGLDAILDMKGYAGEYGLERYPQFETYNMGSQIQNEDLIEKALAVETDAILVSQVVTQRDIHIKNLTELVELLEAESLRDEFVVVIGGPRISHELALELGFDAGFGSGTTPAQVATYLAKRMVEQD